MCWVKRRMKTKVCHVTSAHESNDDRIFLKECVSLAKAGYDTYLVAKGESREEKGVHVVGLGQAPAGRLKRMTSFAKAVYLKALEIDADIYHLHDPELLPWGVRLKKHGKKVIFDSHENYPAQILNKKRLPKWMLQIISSAFRGYETFSLGKIDAVVVPCTFDGKNIFDRRAARTAVIANYPVLSDFYDMYAPKHPKSYDLCYVGGLTYQRGIFHLIKAAGKAEKRLLLAGRFSDEEFESRVRNLPEFSFVEYVGSVPNSEVADLIQSCHIGANTLLNVGQYHHMDTFGVKVYEYMSMGIPVLMPDYPYARKMMEKDAFGLCVDPENPDNIADAILYLLSHPGEARQMGLNGRKAVEQEFNWSTQEKKLLELYESLL